MMETRRWHRGGGPNDQFHAAEAQRAAPARTGLGHLVEQAFGAEFAQPVEGEQWPGAIAQQPFAPDAVSGVDARRCTPQNREHGAGGEVLAAG